MTTCLQLRNFPLSFIYSFIHHWFIHSCICPAKAEGTSCAWPRCFKICREWFSPAGKRNCRVGGEKTAPQITPHQGVCAITEPPQWERNQSCWWVLPPRGLTHVCPQLLGYQSSLWVRNSPLTTKPPLEMGNGASAEEPHPHGDSTFSSSGSGK